MSNGVRPAATATAGPVDEPPAVRSAFQGFSVGGKTLSSPHRHGPFVLPTEVERTPAVACTSSTVTPTPCSGPHTWPRPAPVGLGGPAACPVRVQGDHRTEPGGVPPDPVELIYEDFGRRDVATPDRRGDLISAGPAQPGSSALPV